MNYVKLKKKTFPFIIYGKIHLVCTQKPLGETELFQTAVDLGTEHFYKLLGWASALSGPDLFRETDLFSQRLP